MKSHSIDTELGRPASAGRNAVDLSLEDIPTSNSKVDVVERPELPQEFDALIACQRALFGLVTQRANAYFHWTYAFSRCESPRELVEEQTRFFDDALAQYEDCSRQVCSAFLGCVGSADFRPKGASSKRRADHESGREPQGTASRPRQRQSRVH